MKNWLERVGLVEKSQQEENYQYTAESEGAAGYEYQSQEVNEIHVDLEGEDFLTVDEVYQKAGLEDKSKSIFKVDEFSKVLPESLPTETKRQSVIGILSASSLEVSSLVEDADTRIGALNGVMAQTRENTASIVSENEIRIAQLLQEVDSLKQVNNERKTSQEKQEEIIQQEVDRINQIKKFISGTK